MIKLPDDHAVRVAYADEQAIRDEYWHPQHGQAVLDVGAQYGTYTLPALLAGARVLAVEPDAASASVLGEIMAINGVSCRVRNCALFDTPGYPPAMWYALMSSDWSHLIPPAGTQWRTLDDLWTEEGMGKLDWVKIDVEGAELGVLASGTGILTRDHPKLLIEDHTRVYPYVKQECSRERIVYLLESLHYRVRLVPYGGPGHPVRFPQEAAPGYYEVDTPARDYLVAT